jgi:hypothetical protein
MCKTLLICVLLCIGHAILGQNKVEYTYDQAGNRLTRQIVPLNKSATIGNEEVVFESKTEKQSIKLYPNPTKGELKLNISSWNTETIANYTVTDISGRKILQRTVSNSVSTIDLSAQTKGSYILRLFIDNEWLEWKIIKE